MNKKQQISTDKPAAPEVVSNQIGLTAIQEKCAVMLAAGASITEVAGALHIDRGTIYCWKKKVTFTCYLNRLQKESKDILQGNLFELQGQALQALKDSLASDNESVKLKAAVWLIERLASIEVGGSEPKEVIKRICSEPYWDDSAVFVNERKYKAMLLEEGLAIEE